MSLRPVSCAHCGREAQKETGAINRAAKQGRSLFCNRNCAGLSHRVGRSLAEKQALKAAYDTDYRARNRAALKVKKAAAYKANPNRERELAYRRANATRHVEYCRRPEYRKWKQNYDRQHRAEKFFGEFAEAALLLNDLEREISSRASRYEIYATNGTLNKWINRRRDYERLVSR